MKQLILYKKYFEDKEFERWFDNSKIVDNKNKPLLCYHGTNSKFDIFKKNLLHGRNGIYFSSFLGVAKQYGNIIIKSYLKVIHLVIINANRKSFNDIYNELDNYLWGLGSRNDGIIVENVYDHPSGEKKGKLGTTFIVNDADQLWILK